jgi:nucleotide-binding universal stress UspA family protein
MTADGLQHLPGKRIVVGIDGSPGSRAALRWAKEEAELRGDRVAAVIAWVPALMPVGAGLPPRIPDLTPDVAARDVLESIVEEVYGVPASLIVERLVEEGAAAKVLIKASVDADLLVLGRGRAGFGRFGPGPVVQQVVQHSHCPVVVLPPGGRA